MFIQLSFLLKYIHLLDSKNFYDYNSLLYYFCGHNKNIILLHYEMVVVISEPRGIK